MAEGESGLAKPAAATPYEEALDALSSLITERSRADESNNGDRFDLLYDYLKILDLDEAISQMKIIHVAGTKGKGSTCTFTEAILRNCGFHTGLFTSPHLIDVCERLKEKTSHDIPMRTYFRFLALLAFKIFAGEQVDVAILEVGLGGRFDATNVVQTPVVCGISSLGYDHMEILGNTLGEIAGEKAGIFKQGVPAFTVPQPDEAMHVLEEKAFRLDVHLQFAQPLDKSLLNGLKLEGEHQYVNAGPAVALSSTWLQKTGHLDTAYFNQTSSLPEQFIKGLTTASLQGCAQIVPDGFANTENPGDLDGDHSPESMKVCARWFSLAINEENRQNMLNGQAHDRSGSSNELTQWYTDERSRKSTVQILLFNCMSVRRPTIASSTLMMTCADHGISSSMKHVFRRQLQALFVPNISVYSKVGSHALPPSDSQVDFSWKFALQRVWENLMQGDKGGEIKNADKIEEGKEICVRSCENSGVFSSLPSAIKWLRESVQKNGSTCFQVLVTGSLHLVGDVLRLAEVKFQ